MGDAYAYLRGVAAGLPTTEAGLRAASRGFVLSAGLSSPTFELIADGCIKLRAGAGFVHIASDHLDEHTLGAIRDAILFLQALTGEDGPLFLISTNATGLGYSLAYCDVSGFCHIALDASRLRLPRARADIAHEVGHGFLSCGNRFLDEGWAVLCGYAAGSGSTFPIPIAEMPGFLLDHVNSLPALGDLLAGRSRDLLLRDVACTEQGRRVVYCLAFLLVSYFVRRQGLASVTSVFRRVKDGIPASEAMEAVLGSRMEAVGRDLLRAAPDLCEWAGGGCRSQPPPPPLGPRPGQSLLHEAREAVVTVRRGVRLGFQAAGGNERTSVARCLAHVRGAALVACAAAPGSALALVAKALPLMLEAGTDRTDRARCAHRWARSLLEAACALDPDEPEAALALAWFLAYSPVDAGRDIVRATALLAPRVGTAGQTQCIDMIWALTRIDASVGGK
jgi:hypothetical protein